MRDIAGDADECGPAVVGQTLTVQLHPESVLVARDQLHLDRLQRRVGLELVGHALAHQRAVGRPQQVSHALAAQCRRLDAEQVGRGLIGEQDDLGVDQGDLGDRRREHGEAVLDIRGPIVDRRRLVEQAVHARGDFRDLVETAFDFDPIALACRNRAQRLTDALDLATVTEQPREKDGNNERSQHEPAGQNGGGPPTC